MTRRSAAAAVLLAAWSLGAGCLEWLEMPDPDAGPAASEGEAARQRSAPPREPARVDGPGLMVPGTPGLRVPEGYWARVRLDTADVWLPYAWATIQRASRERSGGARDTRWTLRLVAVGGPSPDGLVAPDPQLRAVIAWSTPRDTALEDLVGVTFGAESLERATTSLRTSPRNLWLASLDRVRLDAVGEQVVRGVLEGTARRGAKARRARRFVAAFVALRARLPAEGAEAPPGRR